MAGVVTVDRAGRIVIPRGTRRSQGIARGTKFLLVEGRNGSLHLEPLDAKQIAERLEAELRDVDVAGIARRIEAEANRMAKARYPAVSKGRRS